MADGGNTFISPMIPGNPLENNEKEKSCYQKVSKYTFLISLLIVLVLAVIGLIISFKPTTCSDTSPPTRNNTQIFEKITSSKDSDLKCIHHTPQSDLDRLNDTIDSLCVPKYFAGAVPTGMTECKSTRTYIKDFCFCDSRPQCNIPGVVLSDVLQKSGCFNCSKPTDCPCQNNGTCKKCEPQHDHLQCACKNGTTGRFCTKITKRVCHTAHHDAVKNLENCENSNSVSCYLERGNTFTSILVCELKDNYTGFKTCPENEIQEKKVGVTGKIVDNENKKDQDEGSKVNTTFIILLFIAFISFFNLILIFRKTFHVCEQKCNRCP